MWQLQIQKILLYLNVNMPSFNKIFDIYYIQ